MFDTVTRADAAATPTGAQSLRAILARRLAFLAALAAFSTALFLATARLLSPGGFSPLDIAILTLAAPTLLGLSFFAVNAVIAASLLMLGHRRISALVSPYASAAQTSQAAPQRAVLVMTVRNEPFRRVIDRLLAMRRSCEASDVRIDIAILSDSDQPGCIAEEEALFAESQADLAGADAALYRRRTSNEGFKAGNLRAFTAREGADYETMIVLDADSLMDGETIKTMLRIMAAHPRLGVLQSLIQPAPGRSAFTRALRFWARTSVRTHYLGHAWWQADNGAYGGHNAAIRVRAFRERAELPELDAPPPLGGAVLGHDHAEAMLMRGAGWEVRLWPEIVGSWEDHPLTLLDHLGRDSRWRRGVAQYPWLLAQAGGRLHAMGRLHLAHLAALDLWPVAATLLAPLLALKLHSDDAALIDAAAAATLWRVVLALALLPQLVALGEALSNPRLRAGFGGGPRLLASGALDLLFAMLLAPVLAVNAALTLLGLLSGGRLSWRSPPREETGLAWAPAFRVLWPTTVIGLCLALAAGLSGAAALTWSAPVWFGLVAAIPFAVLTASPAFGDRLRRAGLLQIPEETNPPALLRALDAATAEAERPEAP